MKQTHNLVPSSRLSLWKWNFISCDSETLSVAVKWVSSVFCSLNRWRKIKSTSNSSNRSHWSHWSHWCWWKHGRNGNVFKFWSKCLKRLWNVCCSVIWFEIWHECFITVTHEHQLLLIPISNMTSSLISIYRRGSGPHRKMKWCQMYGRSDFILRIFSLKSGFSK